MGRNFVQTSITLPKFHKKIVEDKQLVLSKFVQEKIDELVKEDFGEIRHGNMIKRWMDSPNKAIKEIVMEGKALAIFEFYEDVSELLKYDKKVFDFHYSAKVNCTIDKDGIKFYTDDMPMEESNDFDIETIDREKAIDFIKEKFQLLFWIRDLLEFLLRTIKVEEDSAYYTKVLYVDYIMKEGILWR